HLLGAIARLKPERVAMENVAGFFTSRARELVRATFADAGYTARDFILCPTTLGVPNKRERYYLVAARHELPERAIAERPMRPLSEYLDEDPDEALFLEEELVAKHGPGMRILERAQATDPNTISNCFTGAYGRTFRFSGSFLSEPNGRTRYFSTAEVARLLGFADTLCMPPSFTQRQAYKYLGNSLSVHAVREVLRLF
ncbi:MAG: DNA cytosine methyltransferase, partial [Myxococcota bacterium]